ncbi:MAG: hypothetical protein ABW003_26840, partial [Microvirga sp.]
QNGAVPNNRKTRPAGVGAFGPTISQQTAFVPETQLFPVLFFRIQFYSSESSWPDRSLYRTAPFRRSDTGL